MLMPMRKRLDAWGFLVAMLIGSISLGCSDAQARPAEYPETAAPYPATWDAYEGANENVAIEPLAASDAAMVSLPGDYDLALDQDPSAIDEFQEALAPYGEWADDATYGTVWLPDREVVGEDFAPYVTAGHWALTENDEWLWVSDYEWGWAPFHYGRWVWISGRGWAWIPGRVYAPAWVVWRTGYYDDHYVGWAPMPPTWYWRGGVAVSLYAVPPAPYVFCSTRYIFTPHVYTHIVPASRVRVVATYSRPYYAATPRGRRSDVSYIPGPSPRELRVPARAAPRASHNPRALAAAKPVPGGRVQASIRPRSDTRVIGQPRAGAGAGRSSPPVYSREPRAVSPSPAPHRSVTPTPRAQPSRPTPRVQPVRPMSPRPGPSAPTTPRIAPVRPPAISPRPAPRATPRAPTSPGPAPARVAPAPRVSPSTNQAPRIAPTHPSVAPQSRARPSSPSRPSHSNRARVQPSRGTR